MRAALIMKNSKNLDEPDLINDIIEGSTAVPNVKAHSQIEQPVANQYTNVSMRDDRNYATSFLQTPSVSKYQPNIIISTVLNDPKLLKLKEEIFNIFYILPPKKLKWPDLDDESMKKVEEAGRNAFQAVLTGADKFKASKAREHQDEYQTLYVVGNYTVDLSVDSIHRLAIKASNRMKRKLLRKIASQSFINGVRSAITPVEVFTQLLILEAAIPDHLRFTCNRESLFDDSNLNVITTSNLARRIFILDRLNYLIINY